MRARYRSVIEKVRRARDTFRSRVTRGLLDRPPQMHDNLVDQVVFVRWDGKLGDSIVLSWIYREIRRARPELKVTVLTHVALAKMHREDFGVEDVIISSKRPGFLEVLRLSRKIRHARYVVHLTEQFKPRDFWFIRCVAPGEVVGLDDSVQSVSFKLGKRVQAEHVSRKLLPWFKSIGITPENMQYVIPFNADIQTQVKQSWPAGAVTGFCPLGAGWDRRMSDEFAKKLIRIIRQVSGHSVVLLVAAAERSRMRKLLDDLADDKVYLPESGDGVDFLFARIRQSDFIVTVDTATVHIASGLSKPQICLYNPDTPTVLKYREWNPNSSKAITLFAPTVKPQHIDAVRLEAFTEAYIQLVSSGSD
ncbi:glycosyltransferase family 9 protein [Orrella marina]|uniref:Uncharacterized protein n=1 Tax=Orrella marina TaxID=2163011 RepID=A0A2R4XFP1_9BURK|nr:glycosyltransferase family 9 protein [Orrella marina]AWB32630.1 hypothetical protein DBV39_01650 [Orrella marina]